MRIIFGKKRRMPWKSLAILLFSLAVFSQSLVAKESKIAPMDLIPTAQMHSETLYMMRCLSGIHYNRKPISSLPMGEILQSYLADLDPQHLFFLESDVENIQSRYGLTLDIFLNSGSVKPAFAIYEKFRQRVNERLQNVEKMLAGDVVLSTEGIYAPDRRKSAWPKDLASADQLWKQRIHYELLNEFLQGEESCQLLDGEAIKIAAGAHSSVIENPPENVSDQELSPAEKERLLEAKQKLQKRYHRLAESVNDVEPWFVQEVFLDTVASLYDPHSSFLSADSWDEFQVALTNSLVGIGAVLMDDEGYCKIVEIYPGSPAAASKQLNPGDRIIAVGENDREPVDIFGMRLNRAVKLIRGNKGTMVALHIQPADGDPSQRKVVKLIRDEIQLTAQRARGELFQLPGKSGETIPVGYIKLPAFYGANEMDVDSDSYHDVRELLEKLKAREIGGLILDLRGNTGGLLDEAISLAGLFIKEGPVVQVHDNEGHVQIYSDNDSEINYAGPLIVLISKQSVSASEILAGALQSYGRALIVGDTSTHGKGSVQAILPMNQSFMYMKSGPKLGAARITIQKWYLPDGNSIQQRGVLADIPLPSINDFLPLGESDYEHALPWDKIASAPMNLEAQRRFFGAPVNSDVIKELREKSETRHQHAEMQLLQEKVRYFGNKARQKEFPLQLELRRCQRCEDQRERSRLKEKIKTLAENPYVAENFWLDAAGENGSEIFHKKLDLQLALGEEDPLPEFDIPLRESLRIMQDWIATLSPMPVAAQK